MYSQINLNIVDTELKNIHLYWFVIDTSDTGLQCAHIFLFS
jgi:hypothetical protein